MTNQEEFRNWIEWVNWLRQMKLVMCFFLHLISLFLFLYLSFTFYLSHLGKKGWPVKVYLSQFLAMHLSPSQSRPKYVWLSLSSWNSVQAQVHSRPKTKRCLNGVCLFVCVCVCANLCIFVSWCVDLFCVCVCVLVANFWVNYMLLHNLSSIVMLDYLNCI